MNPRPVSVTPMEDYQLFITFRNGEQKIFDMKPLLSLPLYRPLADLSFFAKVQADGSCIYWDEDIDLCPDRAYTDSQPI